MNAQPQFAIPYAGRNLEPQDLDGWIMAPNRDPDRMRVITGCPGSGKSTFMKRIHDHLLRHPPGRPLLVLYLDLAVACHDRDEWKSGLQKWLAQVAQQTKLGPLPDMVDAEAQFQDFVGKLRFFCAATQTKVVLLIDGWDDIDPNPPVANDETPHLRGEIEELVVGSFLKNSEFHVRIVAACRDDDPSFASNECKKDKNLSLEDLFDPQAYAADRLNALQRPIPRTEEFIMRLLDCGDEQALAFIGRQGNRPINQAAILTAVDPLLCGNPYLNNRLLYYALMGHYLQQAAPRNAIVLEYLQRVPLEEPEFFLELLRLIAHQLDEKFLLPQFNALLSSFFPDRYFEYRDELNPLVNAGLIVQINKREGSYQLSASIYGLLRAL